MTVKREKRPTNNLGRQIAERLEDFARRLERVEPIPATEVRCAETPDGPMHTACRVTLHPREKGE